MEWQPYVAKGQGKNLLPVLCVGEYGRYFESTVIMFSLREDGRFIGRGRLETFDGDCIGRDVWAGLER